MPTYESSVAAGSETNQQPQVVKVLLVETSMTSIVRTNLTGQLWPCGAK